MRTFYIALIFIGCLSLAIAVTEPVMIPARDPAANCTAAAPVTGCKTCTAGKCTEAQPGYFILQDQASACPRACNKCSDATTCAETDCATDGFLPKNAATTTAACQKCKSGWTYDNGVPANDNADLQSVCISITTNSPNTCFTNFYWNSPANPGRLCVANNTGCLATYATNEAGNVTTINGTGCAYCAQNLINVTTQATTVDSLLYWSFVCLTPVTVTPRVVQQCTAAAPTNSCSTCTAADKCSKAVDGFYIVSNTTGRRLRSLESNDDPVTGLVAACPSQCSTCSGPNACDTCAGTSVKDETGFCKCPDGFTPSIPQDLIKKGANITYSCIKQLLGQSCLPPYTWNTPYSSVDLAGSCIQISGNCLTDNRTQVQAGKQPELSLTAKWNQLENAKRQCWLATNSSCEIGYSSVENASSNKVEGSLKGNCDFCVNGFNNNNVAANPMCLAATSSSILAMSIAFLGLLLALVF